MAFTYNPSTDVGKVRLLIGDTDITSPKFQDDELSALLTFENGEWGLAAADALESLAATVGSTQSSVKIGDYQNSAADQVKNLQTQAQRLRDMVWNTPAFAAIEDDVSSFTRLEIIRNWILRNLPL